MGNLSQERGAGRELHQCQDSTINSWVKPVVRGEPGTNYYGRGQLGGLKGYCHWDCSARRGAINKRYTGHWEGVVQYALFDQDFGEVGGRPDWSMLWSRDHFGVVDWTITYHLIKHVGVQVTHVTSHVTLKYLGLLAINRPCEPHVTLC